MRLEEQRKAKEFKELIACTFQPKICSNPNSQIRNSLSVISNDYNNKTFSSFRNSYLKPDTSETDTPFANKVGFNEEAFAFFGKEMNITRNQGNKTLLTANNDDIVVIID